MLLPKSSHSGRQLSSRMNPDCRKKSENQIAEVYQFMTTFPFQDCHIGASSCILSRKRSPNERTLNSQIFLKYCQTNFQKSPRSSVNSVCTRLVVKSEPKPFNLNLLTKAHMVSTRCVTVALNINIFDLLVHSQLFTPASSSSGDS